MISFCSTCSLFCSSIERVFSQVHLQNCYHHTSNWSYPNHPSLRKPSKFTSYKPIIRLIFLSRQSSVKTLLLLLVYLFLFFFFFSIVKLLFLLSDRASFRSSENSGSTINIPSGPLARCSISHRLLGVENIIW